MATVIEYRDEKLCKELEQQIEENECGVFDCLMCFCFGGLGLICIVPKYNKRKLANDRLLLELAKPKYTPPPQQQQEQQAAPAYAPAAYTPEKATQ